jgi:hypothetical protein
VETDATMEEMAMEIAELEALLDLRLPCDVTVPPATVITKGCALRTLAASLKLRQDWQKSEQE